MPPKSAAPSLRRQEPSPAEQARYPAGEGWTWVKAGWRGADPRRLLRRLPAAQDDRPRPGSAAETSWDKDPSTAQELATEPISLSLASSDRACRADRLVQLCRK